MRLRKFRVRAYRCIHDSGEIRVGDLAAFVGRNESGKTTILQALTLLNKETQISELDLCDELVEDLKSEVKLAEGEFELNHDETKLLKETFPNISEIHKIKIFRTNSNPIPQYDFGDVEISEAENSGLNSWENFRERVIEYLDTIPNHIRIKLNARFFESGAPETEEIFRNEIAEFGNNLHVLAADEPQVVAEWEKIADDPSTSFQNLLVGTTEKIALENFIEINLHPRFVYFSDYKKIIGNINLNEYIKERDLSSIEYTEDEFDKAETVDNLFYLSELNVDELEECKNSPSQLIKLLNTCSKRLTEKLNPAWKGDPIHVDLRLIPNNIMIVVLSDVHRDGSVSYTGLLNR